MPSRYIRLAIAVGLLFTAHRCWMRSAALIDESIQMVITKDGTLDESLDFFSLGNPIKDPPTPRAILLRRDAERMWQMARLSALGAVVVAFTALLHGRKRTNELPATENTPCDSAASSSSPDSSASEPSPPGSPPDTPQP